MSDAVTLNDFRKNADLHNVCGDYAARWDRCKSKKDLIDLACEIEGGVFLCRASSEGWGISSQELFNMFAPYLDGRYVSEKEGGATSVLYCRYNGNIRAEHTTTILIDSFADIFVPERTICRIIADKHTYLKVRCPRTSKAYVICDEDTVVDVMTLTNNIKIQRDGR